MAEQHGGAYCPPAAAGQTLAMTFGKEDDMGQNCESCELVMETAGDHGGGKPENARCKNCCHPDGTHKTREELFESTVQWLLSDSCAEMGFPKAQTLEEARERAESILLEQPVWQ